MNTVNWGSMACCRVLLVVLACAAGSGSSPPAAAQAGAAKVEAAPDDLKCRGEEKDPWLSDWRRRFLSGNLLADWAVERLGAPRSCEAEVTATFEGAKFGRLHFTFKDKGTLAVETLPPETSRVVLSIATGFKSEEEGRKLLERYVGDIGFAIKWSDPEEHDESGKRVLTYWVGDPGHNAGASLVYDEERLTAIRFSLAL